MASLSRRRERRAEELYKAGVLHGSIDEPVTKHWAPALCLRLRGFVLSHLPLLGYTPVLNPQDCRDDRVPRAAVPRYSSMDNHAIIIRGVELLIFPRWRAVPPWYRWFMVGNSYVDDIMLMASGKDRHVSHFFPDGGFAFPGTQTGKAEDYLNLHGSCAPLMKR